MKKILSLLSMMFVLLFSSCNFEEVYETYAGESVLSIASISPITASIGTEITITGEGLQYVKSVTFGGEAVAIKSLVSDKEMIVYATKEGVSGRVEVTTALGNTAESTENFIYEYVAPVIDNDADIFIDEVTIGESYLICGRNLNVVDEVLFKVKPGDGVVDGDLSPAAKAGTILSQSPFEILVTAPGYIAGDSAYIELSYYDGNEMTCSVASNTITVNKPKPVIDSALSSEGNTEIDAGRKFILKGDNLNQIQGIKFLPSAGSGGVETNVVDFLSQDANELILTMPYIDGMTEGVTHIGNEYEVFYFPNESDDDDEDVFSLCNESTVYDGVSIYIPSVYFWEDITIGAQDVSTYDSNMFGLDTGILYSNMDYCTRVDPLATGGADVPNENAYYNDNSSWDNLVNTASNTTNTTLITEEQYYSVAPYFHVHAVTNAAASGGYGITIRSAASSATILRNVFRTSGTTIYGLTSYSSSGFSGTPKIGARFVNPASSADGTRDLIETLLDGYGTSKQLGRQLGEGYVIDPTDPSNLFYVDTSGNTVAGLNTDTSTTDNEDGTSTSAGGTSFSATCDHATHSWGTQDGEQPTLDGDPNYPNSTWTDTNGLNHKYDYQIVMLAYYDYGDGTSPGISNIKKLGFIVLKEFGYKNPSGSTNGRASYIRGDIYWQK